LYQTEAFKPDNSKQPSRDARQVHAHATEGIFPYKAGSIERLLWLAYCSRGYLATNDLPSMRDPLTSELQPLVKSSLRLSEPSGLIIGIDQFVPFIFGWRSTNLVMVRYPPPFDNGWVDFEYRVGSVSNIDGTYLPSSFSAGCFLIERQPVPKRFCATSVTGWVEHAFLEDRKVGLPEISHDANVYDSRFTNAAGFALMYAEQKRAPWLDRSDPKLREAVQS